MNVFICSYKLPINFLKGEISHNKGRGAPCDLFTEIHGLQAAHLQKYVVLLCDTKYIICLHTRIKMASIRKSISRISRDAPVLSSVVLLVYILVHLHVIKRLLASIKHESMSLPFANVLLSYSNYLYPMLLPRFIQLGRFFADVFLIQPGKIF